MIRFGCFSIERKWVIDNYYIEDNLEFYFLFEVLFFIFNKFILELSLFIEMLLLWLFVGFILNMIVL